MALTVHGVSREAEEPQAREQIPLARCDRLPVAIVDVDAAKMRFLVDTAATSMLNLRTFSQGRSKQVSITSWRGTTATSAREVSLPELALGGYRLRNLKLPAIDLGPIEEACGGRIDGILGIDLLEQMGATIDLKRRIALLGGETADSVEDASLEEFRTSQRACLDAFNRGDSNLFQDCLDTEVLLFTPWGEVRGREAMIEYLRRRYFSVQPPAHIDLQPHDIRLLGNTVWFGYEYTLRLPDRVIEARGMALCRKTSGRWRLLNMHNSVRQPETASNP